MMHAIVTQVSPSPEQEPAVLQRGCDIVVTAGAGTGKTRTLVARYLALLAEGVPLRALVAITFTRKAAREMRNRVREEVRRYLSRDDLAPDERSWWLERYTALDAARIGTIHSLCAEILRAHPAEAGVDPRFRVPEEGLATILRSRAVDESLAWAAEDAESIGLFDLLGVQGLRDALTTLIGQRLEASRYLARSPAETWGEWLGLLVPRIRAFVDDPGVRACFADLSTLRGDGTIGRAAAAGDLLAPPLTRLLTRWDEITKACEREDWPLVSAHLAPLRKDMALNGRAGNWKPTDPKRAIRDLRDVYDTEIEPWAKGALNLDLDRKVADSLPSLGRLLDRAASAYRRSLDEQQALDFDDLERQALALLQHNVEVRARWQRDVQAILVDEFQDTNERQRHLIDLLNGDAGKLFIVGDAKQSIYRFRGADVTVFRAERERINRLGAAYHLETSYRAHREMVQGLNGLMRPVLGDEEDPQRRWVEPFSRLLHSREESLPGTHAPFIEMHLTAGSKSGGALDRAADALAARIASMQEAGLEYGDFAILCRASSAFPYYEDALDRAHIPFLTFSGRGFYDRPEIRDLLNALRAVADPTDDLALAGLLRSPAMAVSDAGLYRLCVEQDRLPERLPLWEVLQQAWHELGGRDTSRAGQAIDMIGGLHDQVGRSLVADVLKAFLDMTDYRALMLGAGDARAARNVSKLLADAHASGIVGVGEFLEYVEGMRASGAREGEARAAAEGAVQIMTVHAAKGLEFPVVVLGNATFGGRGPSGVLLSPESGVLLPVQDSDGNLPALYRLGRAAEQDRDDAESDRLLYVAATRTREMLLFSGNVSVKKDGSLGGLGRWLGEIAKAVAIDTVCIDYDEEGARALHRDLLADGIPVSCTIYEPGVTWDKRAPQPGRSPSLPLELPPPLLQPVRPRRAEADLRTAEQERDPPHRVWRVVPAVTHPRAPAWVIGSLVHAAIAAWRFPDASYKRWAEARARGHGVTDARQLADAVRESKRLLQRFRQHHLFDELEQAERRLHEVPYSVVMDGRVERGIIDALFLRGGAWTIVEFKTDDVRDEAQLRQLIQEEGYAVQAKRYAAAVERLIGQRPRVLLCMLNYADGIRVEVLQGYSAQGPVFDPRAPERAPSLTGPNSER